MVSLSHENIQKFKDIFEKEKGKEITWEEASEAAYKLIGFYEILLKGHREELQRKKKLEEFPKGFLIEGVGRTCSICGNSSSVEGSWYDKYGLRCLVCKEAVDRKEIPASLAKYRDSFYSKYDLESNFNLKGPTLRSWIKKGIIKARTITNKGKGIHTQLFLIKDNKDFLPPKSMVKSQLIKKEENGKEYIHSEPWYKFVNPLKHLKDYKIINFLQVTKQNEK